MCLRVKGVSTNNDPRTTGAKAGMSLGSCNVCPFHMGHGASGSYPSGQGGIPQRMGTSFGGGNSFRDG